MHFLYETLIGRILLKLLFKTGALKVAAWFVRSPFSKFMIKRFVRKNRIDMSVCEDRSFTSFNDFFTRRKRTGFQTEATDDGTTAYVSPCDGLIWACPVKEDTFFPLKGTDYRLSELFPDKETADRFINGLCVIYRLRATDCHRFCFGDDCTLGEAVYTEGELHSVQPLALERYPVYRRNRRQFCILDTEHFGQVAHIEVGAVLVGGFVHNEAGRSYKQGEEMGYFDLKGSTIIEFFTRDAVATASFSENFPELFRFENEIKAGQAFMHIKGTFPDR